MGFEWSAWMPLMAAHPLALAQLPSGAGLFRIRRSDMPHEAVWIGVAPHGVRQTVERLSRQLHLPVHPGSDGDIPVSQLWVMRRSGAAFEVSGAECDIATDAVIQLRNAYDAGSTSRDWK